jgi:hypothetical protein
VSLLVVVVASGCVAGLVTCSDASVTDGAGDTQLGRALAILDSFVTTRGFPPTVAAVANLRRVDPRTDYQDQASPYAAPLGRGVGVYTLGESVWLRKGASADADEELRQIMLAPARGNYGPAVVGTSTVPDGDFDSPLDQVWTVQAGPIALVSRDPGVYARPPASLRITGTGRAGQPATTVTQVIGGARAAGTEYVLRLLAKTRGLSRDLAVELKLSYRNGSYRFFLATSLTAGAVVGGISSGTTRGWVPVTLTAVAAKAVTRATLFVADTGLEPLRGNAWIDQVELRRF